MSRRPDGPPGETRRPTNSGYDTPGDHYDGPADGYDGEASGYDGPNDGYHPTGSYDGPKKYDGPSDDSPTGPRGKPRS